MNLKDTSFSANIIKEKEEAEPEDIDVLHKWILRHLTKNKNALTAAFSLACLEIRSRNEEAINSTRNMIYSLKVFYFPLY